jgi:CheY-like chemotaxis protein
MGGGGTVWVRARNELLGSGDPAGLPAGSYLRVEIQDSGPGIPPDIIEKIFDPYFTTKDLGTGLGLCVSQSIIRRHGGILRAESPPGQGALFVLLLPAAEGTPVTRPQTPTSLETGQGRLLIMDDEESVRLTSARLFERQGYTVVVASSGEEAVGVYKEAMDARKPFDAVILDLTVRGGMGGREAVSRMLALDPAVRAIVSSGYADSEAMHDYRAAGFVAALPKPYSVDFAARTVREVMQGAPEKPPVG